MIDPIEYLAWDSKFFDIHVGRLNCLDISKLADLLLYADQLNFKLLYIFSDIAISESIIGPYALIDVGGHITFQLHTIVHGFHEVKQVPEISAYKYNNLTPDMLEIAFLSGHMSRFKTDPLLPEGTFEKLYKIWLEKALINRPISAIYTYSIGDTVAGLVATNTHAPKCTIDLLAVSQPYQGMGIASKLINHVTNVCISSHNESVDVKTQLSNWGARALYLKNSFAECDRRFLYHAHSLR